MNLKIVSAGAGSGKTYRLMTEMVALLKSGAVQPEGIIATTFTKKAAAELEERVRIRLLEEGLPELADRLTGALIGTVHGLGVKLLRRFCFEAGVSPEVDIIADEDQTVFFNQSLASILQPEVVQRMEELSERMGLRKTGFGPPYDWRQDIKTIVDQAGANGFDRERLLDSKTKSYQSLAALFPDPSSQDAAYFEESLRKLMEETLRALQNNEADGTKNTQTCKHNIARMLQRIERGDTPSWSDWVSLSKMKAGAKSRDLVEELQDFTRNHEHHPSFLTDIEAFISNIFDLAIEAIDRYETFKQKRGLIDYLDMETQVKKLLQHPEVHNVLAAEIDLLMVDEFQDTSPIQLEIFWKLTQMANHSIWVGDPKQSIYGFRGAEPELMNAIIKRNGGIKAEDIQMYSWRSRSELVNASNALFCKAFTDLPEERVALIPKRQPIASPDSSNTINEPLEMGTGLIHWHYEHEGGRKTPPGKPWMERCIARSIRHYLEQQPIVNAGRDLYRPAQAGDIAILCRSNQQCLDMADALHHQGLKASIARNGLLETPEAKLALACLKYILNQNDSLSVAEIAFLASAKPLGDIVASRIAWMAERNEADNHYPKWETDNPYVSRLDELRPEITELSGAEILNLILEDLDLRRIISAWGNPGQRCDNVDMLRHFADRYEEACNRLHTGASLGGFLLWMNDLAAKGQDAQGSSEQPDAVNVLTYHKSKGLEWPVVILHSLEAPLQDNLWGAQVVSESKEVDLDHLSANRHIRFWRHPYGKQYRHTLLEERVNQSEARRRSLQKALREEARLMYVGITRARDYLIFTSRMNPTSWLNRIWHGEEGATQATLDPKAYETPWIWKGQTLPIETLVELLPPILEHHPIPPETVSVQGERQGATGWGQPYHILPERENFRQECRLDVKNQSIIGIPFRESEEVPKAVVSQAIRAMLDFDLPTYTDGQRLAATERILGCFHIQEEVSHSELVAHSRQFTQWMDTHFPNMAWVKRYPIRLLRGGRSFEGDVDLLLENDTEIVALRHDHFTGGAKKQRQKAADLTGWYYLVSEALKVAFPYKKQRFLLYSYFDGNVLELEVAKRS